MVEQSWGRIINQSSGAAYLYNIVPAGEFQEVSGFTYSQTKWGVVGLTKFLAAQLGQYNITVNCIAPGVTMTEATKKIVPEAFIDMLPAMSAMKRKLEPEDLAGDGRVLRERRRRARDRSGRCASTAARSCPPSARRQRRPVTACQLRCRRAFRRDDVRNGPDDAPRRAGACGGGAWVRVAVRPRAHPHPGEPAHTHRRPATRSCPTTTSGRSTRSSRWRWRRRATERIRVGTGICLVAQRDPIVTAKAVASLDHLSNGRFVFGIGFGWNADEIEDHGVEMGSRRDVAREHVLAMQRLWSDDVAELRRRARGPAAELVVAQARAAAVAAGPHRRRRGPEALRTTSPSTPTDGSRSAAPASARRCRSSTAATEAAGRDPAALRVVPFGTIPDPGKLDYYASIGIDEVVLRVPAGGRDVALPVLDGYAELVDA